MLSFSHFILNSFKMKNQKGDDNHAHGSKDNDAKDDSHSHGENGNDGNAIPRPVANNPYAKKQQKKENEAHKMGQLSRHQVKATRRVRVRRHYQLRSNLLSDTASLLPLPKNCRECVLLDKHHKKPRKQQRPVPRTSSRKPRSPLNCLLHPRVSL